jgi:hypothetical protein
MRRVFRTCSMDCRIKSGNDQEEDGERESKDARINRL